MKTTATTTRMTPTTTLTKELQKKISEELRKVATSEGQDTSAMYNILRYAKKGYLKVKDT